MKEYREPQTLYEQEQRDKKRKERTTFYQNVLGKKDIPRIVQGLIVNTNGKVAPTDLLKVGGYFRLGAGGYEKRIDAHNRYHAYILPDGLIEIHTDTVRWFGDKKAHVASRFLVKEERARLRDLIPKLNKKHPQYVGTVNPDILPREARLEAMARLKDPNYTSWG